MTQVITPPELTLQEAAEMLNLSEAYVADLLDETKPATQRVGKLRSLRLADVLAFKLKSDADRLDALKGLVAEAQELDMGYLTERAKKGDRKKFLKVLKKVPDVEPEEYDEME